jgi:hypothetical protein
MRFQAMGQLHSTCVPGTLCANSHPPPSSKNSSMEPGSKLSSLSSRIAGADHTGGPLTPPGYPHSRVGTFHHVVLQSKHQLMTATSANASANPSVNPSANPVVHVTNLTPGSANLTAQPDRHPRVRAGTREISRHNRVVAVQS